ncbi:phosphoribosylformylglycinamidine synthase subunit PurL [Candidatus Poribacteria bacterium]|nr:MAG: phosphoribosylformylglycinamidine synthase subunit PurL [Candidatus Poribacteria bacterium]
MRAKVRVIPILEADDEELERISREGLLSLNLDEMRAIQAYFRKLGRNPTDVELETIALTWSEHCVHKTFKGLIEYTDENGTELIDNLLKSTIMRATYEINKPWCVSVFVDNAGIIEFDENYNIAFKVETHNHPSAVEPYGGAGTGIGGVIRDPLGTGLGAKPILNTDVFCFGMPDYPYDQLPKGVLHPKRIFKGVVAGVRDYGNRMGIPTVNGAILFDNRYLCNPIVYCGNVGLIPKNRCSKRVRPGDLIVVVGGRTGRDGIHGATFASLELDESSERLGSVVQIGNPIVEKKLVDTLLQARDRGLYSAITDCGAGGFSSAIGEMGAETGALVHLEKVPLKYEGLAPWEIWLSESQERMVLAVPPENVEELLEIFASEDVEAAVIGEFTDTKRLVVMDEGEVVDDLEMEFLHKGRPNVKKKAVWIRPTHPEPDFPQPEDLTPYLLKILSSPNVASKEWVIRQYDHEVQGGSVLKPLQGAENDGPGDAAVVAPVLGSKKGIAVANGINPKYGDIDTYWMAASAIDEALRNITAVGGSIERTALLDNFSWGNPDKPDRLGSLVRAAKACYDIAVAYGTPFISGKDSLYNEYKDRTTGEEVAIPPTLLISAICVIEDVTKVVSMDAKSPGDLIYVVGLTFDETGGSHYYYVMGYVGNKVPKVRPEIGKPVMLRLHEAIQEGLVRACHDCSEGGIGVAAAEMAFAGGYGMEIDLKGVPLGEEIKRDDFVLFSESNSRFIVEVAPENRQKFEEVLKDVPFGLIGRVREDTRFLVRGRDGRILVDADIRELKRAWKSTFDW